MTRANKSILLIWIIAMLNMSLAFAEPRTMSVKDAKAICAPFDFQLSQEGAPTEGQKKFFNDVKNKFWQICANIIAVDYPYQTNFSQLSSDQVIKVLTPNTEAATILEFFHINLKKAFPYSDFFITFNQLSGGKSTDSLVTKKCIEVMVPGYQQAKIACTYPTGQNSVKQVSDSYQSRCLSPTVEGSKVSYNITSKVVECIKEAMDTLFTDFSEANNEATIFKDISINTFHTFQSSLVNVIRIILVLYVIFFGIKIVTSDNMPSKSDIFVFLLKFVLVVYFAVGFTTKTVTNTSDFTGANLGLSGSSQITQVERSDGVTQILKPIFFNMTDFLTNLVLKAGGEDNTVSQSSSRPGVCNLPSDYKAEFEYLSIWDKIDCRMINYLGIIKGFISKIFVLLISLEFINFLIFVLIFAFLLSIIFFFVHIYVFSLIALTVLTFISPIFITCVLFERTKGYFEAWLKLCISFILQPLIIVLFLSLTFLTFDMIIFKGCNVTTDQKGYVSVTPGYNINDNSAPQTLNAECETSLGYLLYNSDSFIEYKSLLIIAVALINPEARGNLVERFNELFEFFVFLTLFSMFADSLAAFAMDLTEGISLSSMVIGPKALYNKVLEIRNAGLSKLKSSIQGNGG